MSVFLFVCFEISLTLKGAGGGEKRPPYGFSVFSQKIFTLTLLEIS